MPGIVVTVRDGGCGGWCTRDHLVAGAVRVARSPMGDLQALADDGKVLAAFAAGTWINWHETSAEDRQ